MATLPIGTKDQILFPINPDVTINPVISMTDDNSWRKTEITSTVKVRMVTSLEFKIHRDNAGAFFSFLNTNYNVDFTLDTVGYDVFQDGTTSNTVRVLDKWKAIRAGASFYSVTITFLKVS